MYSEPVPRRFYYLLIAALLALAGCGGSTNSSAVNLFPPTANVVAGTTLNFFGIVQNSTITDPRFSVQPGGAGGTIDQNGIYTAPPVIAKGATDTVVATSKADSSKSVSVTVNLVFAVTVFPNAADVSIRRTLSFKAQVAGDPTNGVVWSVNPGGAGGTIDQKGVYTAPLAIPSEPGTDTVVATSTADNTKSAAVTVTVHTASGGVVVQ